MIFWEAIGLNTRLIFPRMVGPLIFLLVVFAGCSSTTTTIVVTATTSPATATPTAGICNPADFPSLVQGGPDYGFQYPPLTYSSSFNSSTGHENYSFCSPGTPSSILVFLTHSLPAGGWNVTAVDVSSLDATQVHSSTGYCSSVHITVGDQPGYPGEWGGEFLAPITPC